MKCGKTSPWMTRNSTYFDVQSLAPMILRHKEMFPFMHRRISGGPSQTGPSLSARPRSASSGEKYPGTDRYAPCPCNSGEKYKFFPPRNAAESSASPQDRGNRSHWNPPEYFHVLLVRARRRQSYLADHRPMPWR